MLSKSNLSVRHLISILLAINLLSSCTPVQVTEQIQTVTPVPPTLTPTITLTPTETPTPTATPVIIPTLDVQNEEISGQYSVEQLNLIESGAFAETENQLQAWVEYWMQSSNPPFDPESFNLQFKYVFDDTDLTGQSAGVLLENPETGETFYLPIKDGQYMTIPPEVPEYEAELTYVPEGFGPLELSGEDYILAWRDGSWARVDSEGNIRETLNVENAQWEATENYKDFSISNSIEASVKQSSVRQKLISQEQGIRDISKEDYTSVYATGFILSYDFIRENGDNSLYVAMATYEGVFRVKVDFVNISHSINFSSLKEVSELTNEESQKIAEEIDSEINLTNERPDFNDNGVSYIIFDSSRSQNGVNNCISAVTFSASIEMARKVCTFDSEGYLEPEDAVNLFEDSLVPVNSTTEFNTIISISGYKIIFQLNKERQY